MAEKLFCPFRNVVFCKFLDKCKLEHAKCDCIEENNIKESYANRYTESSVNLVTHSNIS